MHVEVPYALPYSTRIRNISICLSPHCILGTACHQGADAGFLGLQCLRSARQIIGHRLAMGHAAQPTDSRPREVRPAEREVPLLPGRALPTSNRGQSRHHSHRQWLSLFRGLTGHPVTPSRLEPGSGRAQCLGILLLSFVPVAFTRWGEKEEGRDLGQNRRGVMKGCIFMKDDGALLIPVTPVRTPGFAGGCLSLQFKGATTRWRRHPGHICSPEQMAVKLGKPWKARPECLCLTRLWRKLIKPETLTPPRPRSGGARPSSVHSPKGDEAPTEDR